MRLSHRFADLGPAWCCGETEVATGVTAGGRGHERAHAAPLRLGGVHELGAVTAIAQGRSLSGALFIGAMTLVGRRVRHVLCADLSGMSKQ